jgi:hypothetical protein
MLAACNFHKGADDIAQEGKRFIDVSRFLCVVAPTLTIKE